MNRLSTLVSVTLMTLVLAACGGGGSGGDGQDITPTGGDNNDTVPIAPVAGTLAEAGRALFFDTNLSSPPGQACASCHDPDTGFADPDADQNAPVSEGAVAGRFGNRNAPTAAYAAFIPARERVSEGGDNFYRGGLFLDGRRDSLAAQAGDPFLNPDEMANPDKAAVVEAVKAADYAGILVFLFGEDVFDDVENAYARITEAIAAFERTDELNPFTSKYDYYLAGQTTLSDSEARGLDLFQGDALCSTCHTLDPLPDGSNTVLSDFRYWNLGVPANPDNPSSNVDRGLGGDLGEAAEDGKFRTPTLRNVELTAPYMHNGVFATLEEVVDFYVTRDDGSWQPEVSRNMETTNIGADIAFLSAQDQADLVAFLKTLTDGYSP